MTKGVIFGKRFCTFCGRNSVHYYKWQEPDGEHIIGECFTRGCGNVDWCYDETEESIKKRFADRSWVDMNEPITLR